jgi:hypothetical protein
MKLSSLSEAGMSRRDFLKKTGASSILPSLINTGMAPEVAKDVASGKKKIFVFMANGYDQYEPSGESFNGVSSSYNMIRRLAGRDANVVNGPEEDWESYIVGAQISPERFIHLFDSAELASGLQRHANELDYAFRVDGTNELVRITSKFDNLLDSEWADYSNSGNILKSWWENWGQRVPAPLDISMFNRLKKSGVDPTDREDWVKEEIKQNAEEFPDEYGDLEKYGIEEEPIQEPEDNEAPEDYRWASSMHQPFESKLARILGVL